MTSYIYDMVDTWNAGATTFTAVKMNVTDTASAAGSLLMDLQVGGSSRTNILKSGTQIWNLYNTSNAVVGQIAYSQPGGAPGIIIYTDLGTSNRINILYRANNSIFGFGWNALTGGAQLGVTSTGNTIVPNIAQISWNSTDLNSANSPDLFLTRRAAANLRLGAADAAAPVAQTLSVQSVVAGTTNTAGANLTITGSQGTGTGAGGSIVFQVAPAGSSGTAQNALADALTINSARQSIFAAGSRAAPAIVFSGATTMGFWNDSNSQVRLSSAGADWIGITASTINLPTATSINWAGDVYIQRDAANTLALRNGANAQTFRVYNTTDGTNSEFGKIAWSSNVLQIGTDVAGTGTVRGVDITIGSAATYNVRTNQLSGPAFNATNFVLTSGYVQMNETTAPVAAANAVRLYTEDNGSGKTRLMALFPTGAAVQIAIEP